MIWTDVADFFGASVYAQHALCLSNDPILMALYVASDMATAASYFVIGLTLLFKQAKGIAFSPAALKLFGAFIFLCGASHATMTLTLFSGMYRLDILVRVAMAGVSSATAVFTALEVYGFRADGAGR